MYVLAHGYVSCCVSCVALQIEVQGKFWNTNEGAAVTTTAPNKTQKRKHQINSLAFQVRNAASLSRLVTV